MDTIPSSSSFSQVSPPGGFVALVGSPKKEAPVIQITGADPICGDPPPLSPPDCGVELCEWDVLHRHHDHSTGDAENATDWDSHPGQRHPDPGDSRGRPRRSDWAGLGKCPSPSRNSPRRHSPIPYSPKRQHHHHSQDHHRNSSAGLNDFSDIALSPRRHSHDTAFLSRGNTERPSSLPLTSFPSDEFICVSYTDSFSSPTITHASDALLAISINCSQDMEDDDMETMSDTGEDPIMSNDVSDRRSDGGGEGLKEDQCVDSSSKRSPAAGLSSNGTTIAGDGSEPASDSATFNKGLDQYEVLSRGETPFGSSSDKRESRPCENESGASYTAAGTEFNSGRDSVGGSGTERIDSAVESMEDEEGFHEAYSSDSSSEDDDMEEMLLASQPCRTNNISNFGCRIIPCVNESDSRHSSTGKYCSFSPADFVDTMRRRSDGACTFSNSSTNNNEAHVTRDSSRGLRLNEHTGSSGDHDACSLSVFANGSAAWRRASFPGQPTDLPPLTSRSPWQQREEEEEEDEASRRRRSSSGSCVSKTPEDYALPRVVGVPPLHFPHGQGVVLVHCALPSPYDPDLPTPPIVLTPHTSYMDLNDGGFDAGAGTAFSACQHGGGVFRCWDDCRGSAKRMADISRSRSFPNLGQEHSNDRFQEPDQIWPQLGELSGGGGQCGYTSENVVGGAGSNQVMNGPGGCQQQHQQQQLGDRHEQCNTTKVIACRSLPGSPSHNGRAAVIGRLRSVVERRLSGTMDSSPDGAMESEATDS